VKAGTGRSSQAQTSPEIPENAEKQRALRRVRRELTDGTGVIPTTLFGDGTGSISLVGARKVTSRGTPIEIACEMEVDWL
jgi:hypothetical protein